MTENKIQEGRAKLMRLQSHLETVGEAQGCGSCRHLRRERVHSARGHRQVYYCGHPIYCDVSVDLMDGGADLNHQRVPIHVARDVNEPCGPLGDLHERRLMHRTRKTLARIQWS